MAHKERGTQLIAEWGCKDAYGTPVGMSTITYASTKPVQWVCQKGHMWSTAVYLRTLQNNNCPYCSTHRVDKNNNLLNWCQKNGALGQVLLSQWTGITKTGEHHDIDKVPASSSTSFLWHCPDCGCTWYATLPTRLKGNKPCPICRMSGRL